MVDRGASLGWLSQYPAEEEILFAPLAGLEVLSTRVEGAVLVVEVRVAVNLASSTIEQVVSKRRKLVADMCENLTAEASTQTRTNWPAEYDEAHPSRGHAPSREPKEPRFRFPSLRSCRRSSAGIGRRRPPKWRGAMRAPGRRSGICRWAHHRRHLLYKHHWHRHH